ncbi:hypothetical protein [Vreelandella sp. EE27]
MSNPIDDHYVYTGTAYIPRKRIEWEHENTDREKIIGTPWEWYKRTQDNAPSEEYNGASAKASENWVKEKARRFKNGGSLFNVMRVIYNHESIMPPNFSFISQVFFVGMAFGKGGAFFFPASYCFFLLVFFLKFLFGGWGWDDVLNQIMAVGVIFFYTTLASLVVWKGGRLLEKKFPRFLYHMRKAPLWQLNRQTGLFTVYNPKKAWEERVSAPFYEFDAYLVSSPDTQGSSTYSLQLFHPGTGLRQKLDAQFPPTNMPGELVAAWQFIQRYMDVSQPLPDVPALEIHRHKDPTTAAADQRKGRNPRYWRDMSEAEVEKIQEEKYQKNIRLR